MTTLWTVGHSNRPFPEFIGLLRACGIASLVDVRAHPSSRRHPQFDRLELEARLPTHDIAYTWMPQLGGMRTPEPGTTRNAAWEEEGLRAYADYMQTAAFAAAWQQLAALASRQRCVAMCAEAQFQRCHRQLLADAFVARGWDVQHVLTEDRCLAHPLTPTARVDAQGRVTYPGVPELPFGEAGEDGRAV